jgi:hypothetical protein
MCIICSTLTISSHRAALLEKLTVVQLMTNFPPLWNPEIYNCVHMSSALICILIQMNPLHILPFCFFKIHFNVILSAVPCAICLPYFQTTQRCIMWPQICKWRGAGYSTRGCVQLTVFVADGIRKLTGQRKKCKKLGVFLQKKILLF